MRCDLRPLSASRRNSSLHHSTTLCGGNHWCGMGSIQRSTIEHQRLSSLAGFAPATVWLLVFRSSPNLHHAANSKTLLPYFFLYLIISLLRFSRDTRSVPHETSLPSVDCRCRKNSGEPALTDCVASSLESHGSIGPRRNRELHHPGTFVPQRICLDRNDLGCFSWGSRG